MSRQLRDNNRDKNEISHAAGKNARANINGFFSRIMENVKYVNIKEILNSSRQASTSLQSSLTPHEILEK